MQDKGLHAIFQVEVCESQDLHDGEGNCSEELSFTLSWMMVMSFPSITIDYNYAEALLDREQKLDVNYNSMQRSKKEKKERKNCKKAKGMEIDMELMLLTNVFTFLRNQGCVAHKFKSRKV